MNRMNQMPVNSLCGERCTGAPPAHAPADGVGGGAPRELSPPLGWARIGGRRLKRTRIRVHEQLPVGLGHLLNHLLLTQIKMY